MDVIGSVLGGIFIALIVGTALTFGFILIVWFIGLGLAISAFFLLRSWWWRWRFLHNAEQPLKGKKPEIIEVEYLDITDKK